MERKRQIFTLRDILTVIFKHKYEILIIFFVTVIAATAYSYSLTNIYQAKASLLVNFGRENIYRNEVGAAKENLAAFSYDQTSAMNADVLVLTSEDLIREVVFALGVENMYPDQVIPPSERNKYLKMAVGVIKGGLGASIYKRSNVIEVSLVHQNPKLAAKVLNLLVDFFQERHLEVLNKPKSTFLQKQLDIFRQKLKESEDRLEEFKHKHQVYDLHEQRDILLYQRREFDVTLKNNLNRIEELRQKISFLKKQKETMSENVVVGVATNEGRHSVIDTSINQILALRLQEQNLLETYKESNRKIVQVRKDIQLVEDHLSKQDDEKATIQMGKNKLYEQVESNIIGTEAELTALEAKIAIIEKQLDHYDQELQAIDLTQNELKTLERDAKNNEASYNTYVSRVEEARISEDMDRQKLANISVIQAAKVPASPISPRRKLNIIVGILLGAASGLSFALISEYYISQGLSTPAQVERYLGLPVLSTIAYKEK